MNEIYSVDRIENGIAICIDEKSGSKCDISLNSICGDVNEGDIIEKKGEKYYVSMEMTNQRRKMISEQLKSLWEN